MKNIIERIKRLKQEKQAVILAHSYQNIEIDEVADFVGDSLYLSRKAQETDAKIIVFAGVYFMAQTAKTISPDKKVLLPNINAGCLMADMIDLHQMEDFKKQHPNIPVVCYINSTAEVKSKCDICCTSSNALKIVESLNAPKVLFVPDANLGKWVESKLDGVEVITYQGHCPIHNNVTVDDILNARKNHPDTKILIHPECKPEVSALGDYVGSTSGIINYVKNSNEDKFIIVTEKGVVDRLRRDYPNKEFILISDNMLCESMKLTTLEEILYSLENETNEITLDEDVRLASAECIERMLEVSV
ncbi:MAG: quinolinate synthase NadA [Candidatus Gastranaerophilales bacterium]|nr:quinolinate synthase NadA [Candidatus Gastranaerophilales bacterium]MCM1073354.1 quinolinate synthase NadA [Bacteroides sp.]